MKKVGILLIERIALSSCVFNSANKYVVPNSRVGSYGGGSGGYNAYGSRGSGIGYNAYGRGYNVYGGRSSSSSGFGQGLGGGLILGYALGKYALGLFRDTTSK